MKQRETDSPSAVFNPEELLARLDHDAELLQDLAAIFKKEFPRSLEDLRRAVDSKDAKRVAAVAHSLKGMLSNLSAAESAGAAARLEQLGRSGEMSGIREAFALFEEEATKVMPQLEAYLAGVR